MFVVHGSKKQNKVIDQTLNTNHFNRKLRINPIDTLFAICTTYGVYVMTVILVSHIIMD